jgi:hypothetical protein
MNKKIIIGACCTGCLYVLGMSLTACSKKTAAPTIPVVIDTGLVNTGHLDHLYTPVAFPDGIPAAGIFIYSQYPNYTPVDATGEGYTCVDDVSRAALVYLRLARFSSDTAVRSKVDRLLQFILEMQSANGYFYNFVMTTGQINAFGPTSINTPNWWSWRALQALTEAAPVLMTSNPTLYTKIETAINRLVTQIKTDMVNLPLTPTVADGIIIPSWLPAGSATDQSAVMIQGLINYCVATPDTAITGYIRKLADGIVLMQQGDPAHFPFDAFLSWSNTWHAYGNVQAYALMLAGTFLHDTSYAARAMAEIDNFYPSLLQNGYRVDFTISENAGIYQTLTQDSYSQIAYGFEPMVFAAAEAYKETGQEKYADMAGHLAAWLLGANDGGIIMYSLSTGVCFDGLASGGNANFNSGGESTIEALLTLERVEDYPSIKTALNKYKKP